MGSVCLKKFYQLGELIFSLSGNDKILNFLVEEFKSLEVKSKKDSNLNFIFTTDLPNIKNFTVYSPIIINESFVQTNQNGFEYCLQMKENIYNVYIKSNEFSLKKKLIPDALYKFKDWNFLSPGEVLAKNFMYDIFDYLAQIINLKTDQSFIHASAFTKDGRTVLIPAWGGIGKTTSMLKLVNEQGWKFLSDDLALISKDNKIYRTPKKLQIYAYNLENQEEIKKIFFNKRDSLDKLSWKWHLIRKGKKGVRRRISAEELFGAEKIGDSADITDVIYIERADVKDFTVEKMEISKLAKRAASTIFKEIEPFSLIASAVHSYGGNHLPNIDEVLLKTQQNIFNSLKGIDALHVKIPINANPDSLCEFLNKIINK